MSLPKPPNKAIFPALGSCLIKKNKDCKKPPWGQFLVYSLSEPWCYPLWQRVTSLEPALLLGKWGLEKHLEEHEHMSLGQPLSILASVSSSGRWAAPRGRAETGRVQVGVGGRERRPSKQVAQGGNGSSGPSATWRPRRNSKDVGRPSCLVVS